LRTALVGDPESVVGTKLRSATHLLEGGLGALRPAGREAIAARLERLTFLDPVSGYVQRGVRAAVPQDTAAKDVLSGTWLGHPIHPPLTDVVVGSWTSAWLLDLFGGQMARSGSELLLGTGIATAVPTAAAGLSDWAELRGGTQRVGLVHAFGNTTALTLQVMSLRARLRGDHSKGVGLSTLAMGVAGMSAWLGGHLSFGRGVGVNQTAFEDFPAAWTALTDDSQLEPGKPIRRSAQGAGVMLVRHHGVIHALADRCSHRGCSLADGTLREGTITCKCHGSTFTLDGRVVTGPATAPQPSLEVRVREGKIEVRRRSDSD
jgi:nitrite reductase/ring-hydroxylating ferredoxin subunit/uncharacterized membrane protein